MHAFFLRPESPGSTLEALVYEMPFGLVFRKAVLWHQRKPHVFRNIREISKDRENLKWNFRCDTGNGLELEAAVDGQGRSLHHVSYQKTDCSGSFDVANNSIARATVSIRRRDGLVEQLETTNGAVLEMTGYR